MSGEGYRVDGGVKLQKRIRGSRRTAPEPHSWVSSYKFTLQRHTTRLKIDRRASESIQKDRGVVNDNRIESGERERRVTATRNNESSWRENERKRDTANARAQNERPSECWDDDKKGGQLLC